MIKEYRKLAGFTQKEFSELFQIPIDVVKSWDSGRRKPPEWAEKLIIEKLESKKEVKTEMEKRYSDHYDMACMDIGSNGYKILKREIYKKFIAKTVIKRFKNGLGAMEWQDEKGLIIARHAGALDFDYYPCIGEVIEVET